MAFLTISVFHIRTSFKQLKLNETNNNSNIPFYLNGIENYSGEWRGKGISDLLIYFSWGVPQVCLRLFTCLPPPHNQKSFIV